jgi:glucose-1-phosphatase
MTISAVIFDLGGVLLRTDNREPRENLASRLSMTYAELDDLVFNSESARKAMRGEITSLEHWENIRLKLGLTSEHWENIRLKLGLTPSEFAPVPKEFWAGDKLDTELVDYLRSLRPEYKTALLSNAWDDLRLVLQDHLQILDAFDETIISAEVGFTKPDPHIYQIALERLEVPPQEAVFVDDFVENVKAAHKLSLHTIQFKHPNQVIEEINAMLDKG